jgi:glycosyltransferase involved in cell wall biosynthesis
LLTELRRDLGGASPTRPLRAWRSRAFRRHLLLDSPLFDEQWYAMLSGRTLTREEAVRDYLTRGARDGLSPTPLFDRDTFLANGGALRPGFDVFSSYLTVPANWRVSTHPLFDVTRYVAQAPAALHHPGGPLQHYLQVGIEAGLAPNDWFRATDHPEGLVEWVREQGRAWRARQRLVEPLRRRPDYDRAAERDLLDAFAGARPVRGDGHPVLVSILLPVWNRAAALGTAIDSVVAQTLTDWELLVVDDGSADDVPAVLARYRDDPRVRLLTLPHGGVARARNAGIAAARGQYLAWLDSDDEFTPEHLRVLLAFMQREGLRAGYDILELRNPAEPAQYRTLDGGWEYLQYANHIGQTVLVCERSLLEEVGTYDESLPRTVDYDLILRIAARTELRLAPFVGCVANHDPDDQSRISTRLPDTWADVVINRNVIDWEHLDLAATQARPPGSVTVVIPTPNEYEMTTAAVESVVAAARDSELSVEIIVIDNGTALIPAEMLASLACRHPAVSVVPIARNAGFALGNNLALPHANGATVVLLNNDTRVYPGWLEPLVAALDDPKVLGAQSLLVYDNGSIQSAGVVFPTRGGVPHVLLQGFPVEDSAGMADQELHAITGAALAVRFTDLVALRGLDPIFRNGLEDVDLCLRLAARRPGSFRVLPDSRVEHLESRSPGRSLRILENREIFRDRWGSAPVRDDVRQWRARGFAVVGYHTRHIDPVRSDLSVPWPVLTHIRAQVHESPPRLRWAIKNPAPAHHAGKRWGDTHFAQALAEALRGLGQQVSVDAYPAFNRPTGSHDDVVLTLRGLHRYQPIPGQLNLLWVISHPDLVTAEELSQYDRVFAASTHWARTRGEAWGVSIHPLLQATDPGRFRPDTGAPDTGPEVLFVGNSRRVLRPIVRDALEAKLPLTVYGGDWGGLIPDEFLAGEFVANDRLAALYRESAVVLSDHWDDMRVNGFLSNRLFDAVASGARVISDDVVGCEEVFGASVQVSRGPEDLHRLGTGDLDALFGGEEARLAAAAAVAKEHSFAVRARILVESAAELSSSWTSLAYG